jgi:hypothetical protein
MAQHQHSRIDDDDDDFENGILKDGHTYRVPMQMRDGVQRMRVVDALGRPARNRPGYLYDATLEASLDSEEERRLAEERRDYEKAQLSARWRGGLAEGDHVTLAGRHAVVSERKAGGKVVLRALDHSALDAARAQAYADYDRELEQRYKSSGDAYALSSCERESGGAPTRDWSDPRALAEWHRLTMDRLYAEYDRELEAAWRSK